MPQSKPAEVNLPKVIFGTSGLGNLYTALSDADKCAIVEALH